MNSWPAFLRISLRRSPIKPEIPSDNTTTMKPVNMNAVTDMALLCHDSIAGFTAAKPGKNRPGFRGKASLALRRAWALPLYVVSLALFLAALYRAFILANAAQAMSPSHIGIQVVFTSLTVFAIWFSLRNKSKGVLR